MEMRRKDRKLSDNDTAALLEKCEYGVLSMITEENTPYAIPVNYVYAKDKNKIYIHCAKVGRKINCIERNPDVVFSVVENAKLVDGEFTSLYESAVVFGSASLETDSDKKREILLTLCKRLFPNTNTDKDVLENTVEYIEKFLAKTAIIKIAVTEMSGKANK